MSSLRGPSSRSRSDPLVRIAALICLLLLLVPSWGAAEWPSVASISIPKPVVVEPAGPGEGVGDRDIVDIDGGKEVHTNALRVMSHPQVTGISPTCARWGWSSTLTISGQDLAGVTRVVMTRAGCNNITSTGVTPSESTIAAALTMIPPYNSKLFGPWNVTVVTSDGAEATLVGAFELVGLPKVMGSNVTTGRRGTVVPFRLDGENFMGTPASLSVRLYWAKAPAVTIPAQVVSVSRTTIEGTFVLPLDAPLHGYDLIVRDVDGSESLYSIPFSLLEAPTITTVSPSYLPAEHGARNPGRDRQGLFRGDGRRPDWRRGSDC